MPGLGVLEFLPAGGEQLLGPGEIRRSTPGEAEREKNMRSEHQRPCLPYRVARPAEVRQGTTQVLVGLAETAHLIEHQGAPMEHAAGQATARGLHRPAQDGQPLSAMACPRERYPE